MISVNIVGLCFGKNDIVFYRSQVLILYWCIYLIVTSNKIGNFVFLEVTSSEHKNFSLKSCTDFSNSCG